MDASAIIVYRNVNTGANAYGFDGSGVAVLASGREVPVTPVWEADDACEITELPTAAAEVLFTRLQARIEAEQRRQAVEESERRARAAYRAETARINAEYVASGEYARDLAIFRAIAIALGR